MSAGRPTDYAPEILETAMRYLEHAESDIKVLPSVAGLARKLDVSRSTIYDWAKQHQEFSYMLERILALQEGKLLQNGLNNEWNSTITKLVLSKHGYRDSQDVTTDGKALPTPILGAATKEDVQENTGG